MILEKGDMWSVFGKTDLFVITTNPVVNKQGLAVMGRGIARQAADRFPTIRKDFADRLKYLTLPDVMFRYTGYIGKYDNQPILYFMVKDHWANDARLDYIDNACKELVQSLMTRCVEPKYMMSTRVDLNFPGIGNGKLKREDVLPIIEQLPDNIHVWEYSHMDQKEFWEG